MLNEERKRIILDITNERKSITIVELMEILDASESTVRRDLSDMDKKGLLKKVHGGAISLNIAKYAASLIKDNDVVYLDAGTTTSMMIAYLKSSKATFITNCVSHARQLSQDGHQVYLPGGLLKSKTEAIVGSETYKYLEKMNFTMGFFGTNGINNNGHTTPDPQEAQIKEVAFNNCIEKYILADPSKFDKVCTARFAKIDQGFIITDSNIPDKYKKLHNSIIVDMIKK